MFIYSITKIGTNNSLNTTPKEHINVILIVVKSMNYC